MKRILITFSGAAYDQTTERIITYAPRLGVDEVHVYDDRWLMEQEFFTLNQWLWAHHGDQNNNQRGFGWFAWKPFILMHALEHCAAGDIVMYLDADTFPIADLSPLYNECSNNGGIMLFEAQGCWHANWCKRDCLVVMAQDDDRYRLAKAGVARFALFQRGRWRTQQFLAEWLTYCLNPLAQTFDPSRIHDECSYFDGTIKSSEHSELKEHRTEQAIMTNLAHKYGIKLYREASQEGNQALSEGVDAWYGQLFEQLDNSGDKRNLSGSKWRNIG